MAFIPGKGADDSQVDHKALKLVAMQRAWGSGMNSAGGGARAERSFPMHGQRAYGCEIPNAGFEKQANFLGGVPDPTVLTLWADIDWTFLNIANLPPAELDRFYGPDYRPTTFAGNSSVGFIGAVAYSGDVNRAFRRI